MAIEIEQIETVRIIKMAGQASTQSFSTTFLPMIAEAIDAGEATSDNKARTAHSQ